MLETDTFWALVGLVLFLALVVAVGAPKKIAAGLDARTVRIREELEAARRSREEARALLLEYQKKRGEAEQEAQTIVEEPK